MEKNGIKAYLFSVGEKTTELSKWSLERLGFEVILIQDPKTTLSQKYSQFIKMHVGDEWVVRCDADIIVNRHFKTEVERIIKLPQGDFWWWQFRVFCFLKQEVIGNTPMLMRREVFDYAKAKGYDKVMFANELRPETALFRDHIINPHTITMPEGQVVGMHGWGQSKEDIMRVMEMKNKRRQLHNWDLKLTRRINEI